MVVRRSPLRWFAGGVTGLLLGAAALSGPASAAPADPDAPETPVAAATAKSAPAPDDGDDAPLSITIDRLTPGVLPRTGPLVVRGTVTNVDLEVWQDISLYPLFSVGPGCAGCAGVMTSAAELELAADTDAEELVGNRFTDVQDDVPDLAPGQSTTYALRIPQAALRRLFGSATPGVYWFGVHALGSSDSTPADKIADGRARTFLPLAPSRTLRVVDTALVVPLRAPITHTADGALATPGAWSDALAVDGSLGGPLAFGAAGGINPVTWLLDPAILDAVRQLARGNRPRDVTPVPDPDDPEPSDDPSEDDSEGEDEGDSNEGLAEDDPLVNAAAGWLTQAKAVLTADVVATLPYGNPDLAAVADHLPSLYGTARDQASAELASWDVDAVPVAAAPDGYVDPRGIAVVDDGAAVLLSDQMFPTETFSERPPTGARIEDRPVVVTSQAAADGGPGPDPATAAVALRQRILSEALVRLLAGVGEPDQIDVEPLVVVLPESITAADAGEFWAGLDLDWLRLTDLDSLLASTATSDPGTTPDERQIDPADLSYPASEDQLEVRGNVMVEAGRLIRAARSLQAILGDDYAIGQQLIGEALSGTSYDLRTDRDAAARLGRTRAWVEQQLGEVTIEAPSGVTLSGTSGGFNVSVRNNLPFAVTVNVAATTDDGANIVVANPIRLAANSRTSVPITANMTRTGVHNVSLKLTDPDGETIGAEDTLPLRSGQVGIVIWMIIGTGSAILFVAIAIRLYRRFKRRNAPPAEVEAAT